MTHCFLSYQNRQCYNHTKIGFNTFVTCEETKNC